MSVNFCKQFLPRVKIFSLGTQNLKNTIHTMGVWDNGQYFCNLLCHHHFHYHLVLSYLFIFSTSFISSSLFRVKLDYPSVPFSFPFHYFLYFSVIFSFSRGTFYFLMVCHVNGLWRWKLLRSTVPPWSYFRTSAGFLSVSSHSLRYW